MTHPAPVEDTPERPAADTVVLLNRPLRPDADPAGLSRFADDRWRLSPAVFEDHALAVSLNMASIHPTFRDPIKRLSWLLINHDGRDVLTFNRRIPVLAIQTIITSFRFLRAFTDWLAHRRLSTFVQVTAADLDDYLVHVKTAEVSHASKEDLLAAVMRIWSYRVLLPDADRLPERPPWGGERIHHLLEQGRGDTSIRTPRIHPDTMSSLLVWSLRFIENFAEDITAAFHEHLRLRLHSPRGRARTPSPQQRGPGELVADLTQFLGDCRAHGRPLPGRRDEHGTLIIHTWYLATVLNTSPSNIRRGTYKRMLHASGLPIVECMPLHIPVTGTLEGQPWRSDPIDYREVDGLVRILSAACYLIIGYLSGMRPGEVLTLERGCIEHNTTSGLLLLHGRQWKGAHDRTGAKLPEGQIRSDPWVVAEPVATAIAVLERLHDNRLLFPNLLAHNGNGRTDGHFRMGRARHTAAMNRDITGSSPQSTATARPPAAPTPSPPIRSRPPSTAVACVAPWPGTSHANPAVWSPPRSNTATSGSR